MGKHKAGRPDGTWRAVGLMSGTSMDGIDIALIETDGMDRVVRGASAAQPYPEAFRDRLRQAMADARGMTDRRQRPGCLAEVERELTERHAEAVLRFMGAQALQPSAVDVIGFHGQTVFHRPTRLDVHKPATGSEWVGRKGAFTVQIGDGPALAKATGVDVVFDLRAADCEAGGEGAPLVPVYHRALVGRLPQRPVAFVNIGGVANVTYVGRDGRLVAFDTGPGNALIDDWVRRHTNETFDRDGALGCRGRVDDEVVHRFLSHSYLAEAAPKSLDRQAFHHIEIGELSAADGAATLAAVTAATIARAREHMPEEPRLWIIAGGGRRNRAIMERLAALVENAVVPSDALGLDGDTLEAEAWGYLAVRSMRGLPITFPGTTGVDEPATGGVAARAG